MKAGRPTILTQERVDMAVAAYKDGASHEMTADCIGVCETSIYGWINRGKADLAEEKDTIYVNFLKDTKKARYEYEMSRCKVIEQTGYDGSWQAIAWLLERRNPKVFARNAEEIRKIEALEANIETLTKVLEKRLENK